MIANGEIHHMLACWKKYTTNHESDKIFTRETFHKVKTLMVLFSILVDRKPNYRGNRLFEEIRLLLDRNREESVTGAFLSPSLDQRLESLDRMS